MCAGIAQVVGACRIRSFENPTLVFTNTMLERRKSHLPNEMQKSHCALLIEGGGGGSPLISPVINATRFKCH